MEKLVYTFGRKMSEGNAQMRELLGGKGANLAEMSRIGLPVPPGFTITTECCMEYFQNRMQFPPNLKEQVLAALIKVEKTMGMAFGDRKNPLLLSCRSGARKSMPGMMDTVLNIGLCPQTIPGLVAKTNNERFVYDSYRRLIMMYADVVMEKAAGVEKSEGKSIRLLLEGMLETYKRKRGYRSDDELTAADLKMLCARFKELVKKDLRRPFPDNPMKQLWGGIDAVFKSWNGKRAVSYRRIEEIPDDWGTATNVQAMVFGNMGDNSGTGVAFTRNPATGAKTFYGEWMVNAQGEDVVAGSRTPSPINASSKSERNNEAFSLEKTMPEIYRQLNCMQAKIEKHFRDLQDIEFTIQDGELYILQTRAGKRTGTAAVTIAVDMIKERLITEKEALLRVDPRQLEEFLHPILDPAAEKKALLLAEGLPAGPGGAVGQLVFSSQTAVEWVQKGKTVILAREETNPEDVEGMRAAVGILTACGGMTSHAALVARGWGKCCIVGAEKLRIDVNNRKMTAGEKVFKEGAWISLDGSRGCIYEGRLHTVAATENPEFLSFMRRADKYRKLKIRANAETAEAAFLAREFGAEGIGLFRAEHMFYGKGSEEPLFLLRRIILSRTTQERQQILGKLFRFFKSDVKSTLVVMEGLPVTIRLLDPPLHEFVPHEMKKQKELAVSLGVSVREIQKRIAQLKEINPMMGHRGVRLGVTYPEITEMQIRAVLEAAAELAKQRKRCLPEIMIPVSCDVNELWSQRAIYDRVSRETRAKFRIKKIDCLFGTMIEIPRACLLGDRMADAADFFSFGTNDLTQLGFGFSRDDIGAFINHYLDKKILSHDPFQVLDRDGIGGLIKIGMEKGRTRNPRLKIGICGEHGGDPDSIRFFVETGMDYVSCSPYRVPIARLAAAQAAISCQGYKQEHQPT